LTLLHSESSKTDRINWATGTNIRDWKLRDGSVVANVPGEWQRILMTDGQVAEAAAVSVLLIYFCFQKVQYLEWNWLMYQMLESIVSKFRIHVARGWLQVIASIIISLVATLDGVVPPLLPDNSISLRSIDFLL
jgi:hypothetical protein